MVSNVTLEGPMRAQHDYRFTANVTWKPPLYPYIIPSMYLVRWSKENSLDRSHHAVSAFYISRHLRVKLD